MNYYNDNNPDSVAWMKQLILAGLIPQGDIDDRSITDVTGSDLKDYTQCHFFAGIGGWAEALCLANFPTDRKVWTGSCPCQPFSVAGRQKKEKDERHLWPEFQRLIAESSPDLVFGEQVASNAGRDWLAGVQFDVENLGYIFGATDLCAASVGENGEVGIVRGGEIEWQQAVIGAPHIRQRLWWVADSRCKCHERRRKPGVFSSETENTQRQNLDEGQRNNEIQEWERRRNAVADSSATCGICGTRHPEDADCESLRVGNTPECGIWTLTRKSRSGTARTVEDRGSGLSGGVAHSGSERRERYANIERSARQNTPIGHKEIPDAQRGRTDFWSGFDLIPCLDNKARRVESGTFPLAHGVPARMGRLRGYGNAIVPQVAATFVRAFMEVSGRCVT